MPIPDPSRFRNVLNELLARTGHRFVFCEGWSDIGLQPDPRIFQLKTIDHEWLLPQCQAAIIHGGVGTLTAVLRARIPVIVLSVFADQPWWGRLVGRKKIGAHIPFKRLTAKKLLGSIASIGAPDIRQYARELGDRINREDGLNTALDTLEQYFGG